VVNDTSKQYDRQIEKCREVFIKKLHDYGTSWRILRIKSLIDQIYIKALRIRSIEEKQVQKVDDPLELEYIGIINYCIISLVQLELGASEKPGNDTEKIISLYEKYFSSAKELMLAKNHDYGEAWRKMYISSFTDLILVKLLRMKQIEENDGQTLISEGLDSNLYDIVNYSVFALIKLDDQNEVA
jgi:hypothetical protein